MQPAAGFSAYKLIYVALLLTARVKIIVKQDFITYSSHHVISNEVHFAELFQWASAGMI